MRQDRRAPRTACAAIDLDGMVAINIRERAGRMQSRRSLLRHCTIRRRADAEALGRVPRVQLDAQAPGLHGRIGVAEPARFL
jgi:hypothetical protein